MTSNHTATNPGKEKLVQATLRKNNWHGFSGYILENTWLSANVVPSLGGKIVSLLDRKTGREWMFRNPEGSPKMPKDGSSYTPYLNGWDECFPSILATRFPAEPWADREIPDHGSIWFYPWEVAIDSTDNSVEIKTTVQDRILPCVFERTVQLNEQSPTLSFVYEVHNSSDTPLPFIWSSHPTLDLRPGNRFVMPFDEVLVFSSEDDRFGKPGATMTWPVCTDSTGTTWNMGTLPNTDIIAGLKIFGSTRNGGYAVVQDPTVGSELRFDFDPTEIPYIGMFLNFNCWSVSENGPTYYNGGVEPCIGNWDDLQVAHNKLKTSRTIPAHGSCKWNLNVRVNQLNEEQ